MGLPGSAEPAPRAPSLDLLGCGGGGCGGRDPRGLGRRRFCSPRDSRRDAGDVTVRKRFFNRKSDACGAGSPRAGRGRVSRPERLLRVLGGTRRASPAPRRPAVASVPGAGWASALPTATQRRRSGPPSRAGCGGWCRPEPGLGSRLGGEQQRWRSRGREGRGVGAWTRASAPLPPGISLKLK